MDFHSGAGSRRQNATMPVEQTSAHALSSEVFIVLKPRPVKSSS
jgi:hypothetical protein